jgi:ribosomal protein S18 acetylase RimI-like enzyme
MSGIEIRESRPGDGAACAEVWREVGGFFAGTNPRTFQVPAAEGLAEWFEEISTTIREDATMVHLVAEVDGTIVGSLSATLHEPLDTAARQLRTDLAHRRLHVDSLGVAASHRRGGVGSALVRTVEEWGRARGARVVVLETESDNPTSVPFYEQRMGFTAQAVVFRKELPSG